MAAAQLLLLAIACCTAAAARHLQQQSGDIPGGYQYEGKVAFTHKLQPLPSGWSAMHAQLANTSSRAAAPATHRTILVTRDGRRFTKDLSLDMPTAPGFGEARVPDNAGRSLLQVNTNDFNCVGCPAGGQDTRTQVTQTSSFPYSAIGQLMGQVTSNTALECTGTLIGDQHVLTAGHCVFDIHTTRRMVSNLDFSPGMNGPGHPNGVAEWKNVRVLQQFTSEQTYSTTAINYDFALITLAAPVSHALGWFGIQRGTGDVTLDITSAGYPADKPTGTMWQTTCNNVEYVYGANQGVFTDVSQCQNQGCANILQHSCVASEGQSGASMWDDSNRKIHSILTGKVYEDCACCHILQHTCIGNDGQSGSPMWETSTFNLDSILTGKLSTTEGNSYYVGTKMDAFVFDTLNAWYQEDAGTNSALPQTDNLGGSFSPSATVDSSGSSSTPSAPAFPGVQQNSGSAGGASAASEAATPAATPPSIFGRVSSGGLFGGLSALFNTTSASPMATVTAVAGAPAGGPTAAQAPLPANSVVGAEPTDSVAALITTSKGVSLVFDPLIRPPQQVAAAVKQAADLVTGRRL